MILDKSHQSLSNIPHNQQQWSTIICFKFLCNVNFQFYGAAAHTLHFRYPDRKKSPMLSILGNVL